MVASVQAERRMSAVLPFCGPLIDIFIADDVQAVCSCPGCTRQMGPCTKCVCSLCVWTTFDKRYELSRVCASRARTAGWPGRVVTARGCELLAIFHWTSSYLSHSRPIHTQNLQTTRPPSGEPPAVRLQRHTCAAVRPDTPGGRPRACPLDPILVERAEHHPCTHQE